MTKKLWVATSNVKANSNLYNYEKFISKKFNQEFNQEYRKNLNLNFIAGNLFEKFLSKLIKIQLPQIYLESFNDINNFVEKYHSSN